MAGIQISPTCSIYVPSLFLLGISKNFPFGVTLFAPAGSEERLHQVAAKFLSGEKTSVDATQAEKSQQKHFNILVVGAFKKFFPEPPVNRFER